MKIYAISVMAFSPLHFANGKGEGTYVEHLPALQPAASIEDAAEYARKFCLDKWKPDEDWHSHQAAILCVNRSFYEAAFEAQSAGIVNMSDEEVEDKIFQF